MPDLISDVFYVKLVYLLEISVNDIKYVLLVVQLNSKQMLPGRKVMLILNFFKAIIQLLLII